ncbi:hypothetical protein MFLAVUS_004370 [Mucor flavus]|uniref:Protein kinase domain-containing protein n=1 Tax=Mucor flavus TaxID=439312 RepID=A0ABP9YVQ2_9FUNG
MLHIDNSLEVLKKYLRLEELNKMSLAEIIEICRERNLPTDENKAQLISDLLFWKDHTRPIPAPSTPQLSSLSDPRNLNTVHQRNGALDSKEFTMLFLDGNSPSLDIPRQDLTLGESIGSGGFKDCFKGAYKGETVAIGKLRLTDFSELDLAEVKHEINVLKKKVILLNLNFRQLRHENVIRFIGVCTHPSLLSIVTEICTNGDLFHYIKKSPRPSFTQQVNYMHDIALGVSYLHTRRPAIIHRDLKSMNILISQDGRAKINDFGLARIRPKANLLMHTQCGTLNWYVCVPPEYWTLNPSYTEKVDVYACALIFWEIMTWGFYGYPFQDLSAHALQVAVQQHEIRPPMTKLTGLYPRNLLVLVIEMWETDPSLRPSMSHVVDRLSAYF